MREELKEHGLIQEVKEGEVNFWKHKDPVCCIMYINRLKRSNLDVEEVKSDKAMMTDEEIRDGLEYLNIRLELVKFFINQFEKNPKISIEKDKTLRGNLSILLNYLIPEKNPNEFKPKNP